MFVFFVIGLIFFEIVNCCCDVFVRFFVGVYGFDIVIDYC